MRTPQCFLFPAVPGRIAASCKHEAQNAAFRRGVCHVGMHDVSQVEGQDECERRKRPVTGTLPRQDSHAVAVDANNDAKRQPILVCPKCAVLDEQHEQLQHDEQRQSLHDASTTSVTTIQITLIH